MTMQQPYKPDVLMCLANLSNEEVFTPPEVVNKILDTLPEEVWHNKDLKFLDPVCKSGVFLREIAKRLIKGLEPDFPDLQERLNHIYFNMLYGIAITQLTALMTRRTLYCSKNANGKLSVAPFDNKEGNIYFEPLQHTWSNGKCIHCGASQMEYDRSDNLESHAYHFIHEQEAFKMKFDVIIGNPPYQLGIGNDGGNSSKAVAIYHKFIEQAIKLNPRYLTMIVPSRWMTRSTEGIASEWIDQMLNDHRIRIMHDFLDASGIFPGTPPKGGVNYFLWDRDYRGKCNYFLYQNEKDEIPKVNIDFLDAKKLNVVIRDPDAISILEKIEKIENSYIQNDKMNFSCLVSPKDFFTNKELLTSSWCEYQKDKDSLYCIKYYLNKNIHKIQYGWIKKQSIPKNVESLVLHKIYIPAAAGTGMDSQVLGYPFYGEPNTVCSQTYLVIGYDPIYHNFSKKQCENIITYIKTRFFRYLVSIKKKTQNGPRGVYQFVPLQDFNESWDDEKLYKKYNLTESEIAFINTMIRPME